MIEVIAKIEFQAILKGDGKTCHDGCNWQCQDAARAVKDGG